jgi:hypothetical protein
MYHVTFQRFGQGLSIAVVCAVLGEWCSSSSAQVLYSNYGPLDSFSTGATAATFAGYGKNAARFVPTTSGDVTQVETSLARTFSTTLQATVSIVTEISAGPSSQPALMPVWFSTAISSPVDQRAIYTFTGPRASLVGGQAYWLVLQASDNSNWYNTSPTVTGTTANRNGSPTWTVFPVAVMPAFRVSSTGSAVTPTGACCNGASGACTLLTGVQCAAVNLGYSGNNTTCSPTLCTACPADFDHSGELEVQDIFDFLNSWLAGCP